MKRKIIKLGDSYAISLPKNWIRRYNLNNSNEINLHENNEGTLSINATDKEQSERSITITAKKDDSMQEIYANIYSAYINGFKKIILNGHLNKTQFEVIDEVRKNLIGLEIIEQSENKIIFKDFIHLEDIDLDVFLNNIFNYLIGMATELIDEIKNKNDIGDKIRDMDTAVDRTTNIVFRCLNLALQDSTYMTKIGKNTHELIIISRIIKNLEKIGNMLVGISYHLNEKPTERMIEYGYVIFARNPKIDAYTIQFLNDWISYIKPIRSAFFKKKKESAIKIYTERRTQKTMMIIFKMHNELPQNDKDINREYISKLVSHFEPVISLSYDIAKDVIVI